MKWISHTFELSAYEWRLTYNAAWLLFWLPIVSSVLIVFTALNRNLFRFLLAEDGPIEWLTFGCFVTAMVIGLQVCNAFLQANYKWHAAFFAFFAVTMLFCAGEELSWGQRILNLETPEILRIPGQQDEIVFHNLGGTFGIFNISLLVVELIGGIAFFIKRWLSRGREQSRRINYIFPSLCLAPYFVIPFIYKLLVGALGPNPPYVVAKYIEWTELCLGLGLAIFAWHVLRLLRIELHDRRHDSSSQTGLTPIHSRKG